MNLDIINEQINQIVSELKTILTKSLTPENMHLIRDAKHGERQISLNIKLDEFSPEILAREFSNLKKLFNKFKSLRHQEKNMLHELNIQKQIQKDTFP